MKKEDFGSDKEFEGAKDFVESEFEENLPEIFLFGDNIDEDILNNLANQRVEEKKNKTEAGQLDKIFGSQWNNRK